MLKEEVNEDPGAQSRCEAAAKRRAARDRQLRVEEALRQWQQVAEKKKAAEREKKARVSTTDPEARVMKMGDGGFRPAVNGQFAADTESQVIVGVSVTNEGSDAAQAAPMIDQIEERHGAVPEEYLVDGGYAPQRTVEEMSEREDGLVVYAPVQKPKDPKRDRHCALPDDSEAVAEKSVSPRFNARKVVAR